MLASLGSLVGWLIRLLGRLCVSPRGDSKWLVYRLVGWLVWLVRWLLDRLVGWLHGWLVGVGFVFDWLVEGLGTRAPSLHPAQPLTLLSLTGLDAG